MKNNKLIIFIIPGFVILLTLFILAFISFRNTPNGIYESFKNLGLKNGYGKPADYLPCKKNQHQSCILTAWNNIEEGIPEKLNSVNENIENIDQKTNEVYSLITEEKYKEAYKKAEQIVKNVNDLLNKHKGDIKDIKSELTSAIKESNVNKYEIKTFRLFEEWALVKVTPIDVKTDEATVILKKENGKWLVKLGPGTYFEEEELHQLGAPQGVLENANLNIIDNDKYL